MSIGTTIFEAKTREVMDERLSNLSNSESFPKLGYSFKEAQKITGVGRTTLWKAIDEGRLKCFRVGRRVLFSLKHLQDFMESYESKT